LGKSKGKTVPACAMKGHRGGRGIAPLTPNIGARYRWVGKNCIGTGWAPDQSGHFGEYKSLASLYLGSNTGPPVHSLVAIQTMLS